MKVFKFLKFYKVDKKTLASSCVAEYKFDTERLIKPFEIPEDCSYFEVYAQVEGQDKKLHYVSEEIDKKTYDFSSAYKSKKAANNLQGQSKAQYMDYVSEALKKCNAPVLAGKPDTPKEERFVGYDSSITPKEGAEFSRVQHLFEFDVDNVWIKPDDVRMVFFSKSVLDVPTLKSSVILTSVEKIKTQTFYIGYYTKAGGKGKVCGKTLDGQEFVCKISELISPENIDRFGKIIDKPPLNF